MSTIAIDMTLGELQRSSQIAQKKRSVIDSSARIRGRPASVRNQRNRLNACGDQSFFPTPKMHESMKGA
jgi:hypothetical protein